MSAQFSYSAELPDVVRRLHTRAACASAGHCLQRLPEGELLPDAGKRPATNGDLSADIRRLETALTACALQIETVKDCQD
ncbi:hypothetical protein RZ87_09835 [Enterobacter roggenkampii]|nr:hypothetical protein RZ87_09835 [Enterobacter roggenkampii]